MLTALEGAVPPHVSLGEINVLLKARATSASRRPHLRFIPQSPSQQDKSGVHMHPEGEMPNVLKCLRQIRKYIQIEEKAMTPCFAVFIIMSKDTCKKVQINEMRPTRLET